MDCWPCLSKRVSKWLERLHLKERLDETWRFIEAVESTCNRADIEASLLELAAGYGFSTIFGGLVPSPDVPLSEISSRILFQKFPREWAERYNANGYVLRDPIVERLQRDRTPFDWTDAYKSCSSRQHVALIQGEASEFGLREGHVVPISVIDGNLAAVSFGGDRINVGPEGLAMLSFAASYAVGSYLHHAESRRRLQQQLSPRESDCLAWAAEGKTDWEISVILGISRSTVLKHIAAAREKLGAVNKAHAIAMALRKRVLR